MKKKKSTEIKWLDYPEDHDYPACESYLKLCFENKKAEDYSERLKIEPVVEFKAKDIYRASGLSLLGMGNSHVKRNLRKIHQGQKLSPLLLIRTQQKLLIGDGYHRLCAVYRLDEDALIKCKII